MKKSLTCIDFSEKYFKNYSTDKNGKPEEYSVKSMEKENFNLYKNGLSVYKKEYAKFPSTYIEIGCGNGKYLVNAIKKGIKARGCDFADFFDTRKVKGCEKIFFKEDAFTFLENHSFKKVDFIYENVSQYLNDKDFDRLFKMVASISKKGTVLSILYDYEEDNLKEHNRPQAHSCDWWVNKLKEYNFFQYKKNPFIFLYKINKASWNKIK